MLEVLYLSFVTASLAFFISESKVLDVPRTYLCECLPPIGSLVSCGYCLTHWIALILVSTYTPQIFSFWWLLDFFLTILVVSWLGALQWALLCCMMAYAADTSKVSVEYYDTSKE